MSELDDSIVKKPKHDQVIIWVQCKRLKAGSLAVEICSRQVN
ncbi:hypothetical protein Hanom_Chr09g00867801 [Helianthus anomalus]